jgi:hypothetical protein
MDNKVFNVNGRSEQQFTETLKLAMLDEYGKEATAKGWIFDKKKGFLIVQYGNESEMNRFPSPLGSKELAPMIWGWLKSDEALSVSKSKDRWDGSVGDSDVEEEPGFRIYVEDWGHVGDRHGIVAAVKPIVCWYGK